MLEVCIDSLESASAAINGGANEIEICSALNAGGFTPSIGLVHEVLALVKKLPVAKRPKLNAMIRVCGDRFIYSDFDMVHMLCDMNTFKDMGIDGFVFGVLTKASEVDETKCIQFLNAAAPNKVTFSRAFDYTVECKKAAAIISGLGFYRLLTSGHRANLSVKGAAENIDYLASNFCRGPKQLVIMPGGGITSRNVATFINMGCQIVHSSCKSAVQMPKLDFPINLGVTETNCVYITDGDLVRELKEAITRAMALKHENDQMAKTNEK